MTVVVGLAAGLVAARLVVVCGRALLTAPTLARPNYRGALVPTAGGVLLVSALLAVEGGRLLLAVAGVGDEPTDERVRMLVLVTAAGFAFLGLVDDLLGGEDARGFAGHVGALARGRLTTGMLKLVGGGALALALVTGATGASGWRLLGDGLLIALAANLGNLLDRAPGRTLKVALLVYVPLAIAAGTGAVGVALAPVAGAACGLFPDDVRERLMLGDTGANALGAVLGLAVVLEVGPNARTIVLAVLVALNALAEFVSLSALIERVPPLRLLDRAGRLRPTGDGSA